MGDYEADAPRPSGSDQPNRGPDIERLSPSQERALRWLDENQSHAARWLDKDRKRPRGNSHTWKFFEVTGDGGAIRITESDLKIISPLMSNCPTADKIYGVTDAGRALLANAEAAKSAPSVEPAPDRSASPQESKDFPP